MKVRGSTVAGGPIDDAHRPSSTWTVPPRSPAEQAAARAVQEARAAAHRRSLELQQAAKDAREQPAKVKPTKPRKAPTAPATTTGPRTVADPTAIVRTWDELTKTMNGHQALRHMVTTTGWSPRTIRRHVNAAGRHVTPPPRGVAAMTPRERNRILDEYRAGIGIEPLGKKYGYGRDAIRSLVRDAGLLRTKEQGSSASPRNATRKTACDWNAVRAAYAAGGVSQRQLAARFRVAHSTIGRILAAHEKGE